MIIKNFLVILNSQLNLINTRQLKVPTYLAFKCPLTYIFLKDYNKEVLIHSWTIAHGQERTHYIIPE